MRHGSRRRGAGKWIVALRGLPRRLLIRVLLLHDTQGNLLKKIVDSIKDLVSDANFDCSPTGFALQAMDNSHVSLVAMQLKADGFDHYRCDRPMSMGARALSRPDSVLRKLPCARDCGCARDQGDLCCCRADPALPPNRPQACPWPTSPKSSSALVRRTW